MRLFQRLSAIAVAFTIIACSSGADPEPAEPDAGDVAADTQIFQDTSPDVEPADTAAPDPDAADPIDAAEDVATPEDVPPAEDVVAEDVTAEDVAPMDVEADASTDDADVGADPACLSACDCPQGQGCAEGECVLGDQPVLCCTNDGCPEGDLCGFDNGASGLCGSTPSPASGAIVFNEVLTDGTVSGDPNGDNDPGDAVGDEFVEIVNASDAPVALDGFTLEESTFVGLPRHTFAPGTTIGAGKAIVVFGGGSPPDDIPGTHFEVANAADVGISFGLSLDDSGDRLVLYDDNGDLVALFAWGGTAPLSALSDRSYTRSPDVTGEFIPHDDAQPNVLFSPGTRTDATSF